MTKVPIPCGRLAPLRRLWVPQPGAVVKPLRGSSAPLVPRSTAALRVTAAPVRDDGLVTKRVAEVWPDLLGAGESTYSGSHASSAKGRPVPRELGARPLAAATRRPSLRVVPSLQSFLRLGPCCRLAKGWFKFLSPQFACQRCIRRVQGGTRKPKRRVANDSRTCSAHFMVSSRLSHGTAGKICGMTARPKSAVGSNGPEAARRHSRAVRARLAYPGGSQSGNYSVPDTSAESSGSTFDNLPLDDDTLTQLDRLCRVLAVAAASFWARHDSGA